MTTDLAAIPNEPQIIFGSVPESMTNDALAALVCDGVKQFRKLLPYVAELRARFAALPRGHAGIMGCNTWEAFCTRRLDRTPAAVRHALAAEKKAPSPSLCERLLLKALKGVSARDTIARFSVSEDGKLVLSNHSQHMTSEEELDVAIHYAEGTIAPLDINIGALFLLRYVEGRDGHPITFGDHSGVLKFSEAQQE